METKGSRLAVIALGVVLALGACGGTGEQSPPHEPPAGSTVSCYHDWTQYFLKQQVEFKPLQGGVLSGPGGTQDVPLYHDCQRFEKSQTQYGAFFAIFATKRVSSLPTLTEQSAIPVVQIVAWDDYQPLHITRGFNCVFIYLSGASKVAKIVGSGTNESDCSANRRVDSLPAEAHFLTVREASTAGLTLNDADIPPVARWDMDPTNHQYYFGVKCGAAWCELGAAAFASSQSQLAALSANPEAAPLPLGLAKRYAIKGWYDEQYVAVMSGGTAIPSRIKGTVIPVAALATSDSGTFNNQWAPVVRVLLDTTSAGNNPYRDKLNLGHTPPGQFNLVELCLQINSCPGMPTPPTCTSQAYLAAATMSGVPQNWFAKITRVDGSVAYRCVIARSPPNNANASGVPKTARWHFLDDDDIIWEWCPSGCCETWAEH